MNSKQLRFLVVTTLLLLAAVPLSLWVNAVLAKRPTKKTSVPRTKAQEPLSLQACAPPPSGLVMWLPGDGNANDIVSGNNGSLQNGASFAPGKVGQALSLDGVNDFVTFPVIFSVVPTGNHPRTVDFWFNANPSQVAPNHELLFYGNQSTRQGFGVDIADSPLSPQGNLRLQIFSFADDFDIDTGETLPRRLI